MAVEWQLHPTFFARICAVLSQTDGTDEYITKYSCKYITIWLSRKRGYRVPGIENAGMENAGSHGKRG